MPLTRITQEYKSSRARQSVLDILLDLIAEANIPSTEIFVTKKRLRNYAAKMVLWQTDEQIARAVVKTNRNLSALMDGLLKDWLQAKLDGQPTDKTFEEFEELTGPGES